MRKNIDLIVCDLDSTIYPHHDIFISNARTMLPRLTEELGIPAETLKKEINKASENPVGLDYLSRNPMLFKTEFPSVKKATQDPRKSKAFDDIVRQWQANRAQKSRLYDGVAEVFKKAQETGTKVALLTASPKSATVFSLFLISKAKENALDPSTLSMICCRDDPESCDYATYDSTKNETLKTLENKTFAIPHNFSKDRKGFMDFIIKQHETSPDRTLMVGDSASDARCAATEGTHFACQIDGMKKSERTVSFLKEYQNEDHRYPIVRAKVDKLISPEKMGELHHFTDILTQYRLAPAQKAAPIDLKQSRVALKALVKRLRAEDALQARHLKGQQR